MEAVPPVNPGLPCDGRSHIYHRKDLQDCYCEFDPRSLERSWYCCEQQPCPNRLLGYLDPRDRDSAASRPYFTAPTWRQWAFTPFERDPAPPLNCHLWPHAYDVVEKQDVAYDPEPEVGWVHCDRQPCPHRDNSTPAIHDNNGDLVPISWEQNQFEPPDIEPDEVPEVRDLGILHPEQLPIPNTPLPGTPHPEPVDMAN